MSTLLEILERELPSYIQDVKNKHAENAKAVAFSSFIQKVFEVDISKMDFEVATQSKVMQLRGRIDAVFENIIIEFKRDLSRNLEEAKEELKKYFQSLFEKFPNSKYIGIANDGIKFKVFQPIKKNGVISDIEEIGGIDLENASVKDVFNWFDSYFFSSTKIIPTSEHLKQSFGYNSPTYAVVRQELLELFDKVRDERKIKTKYDNWSKYLEIVYGDKPNEINLFMAHTYLSTFAKLLVYLKLSAKNQFRNYDAPPILQGYVFSNYGIRNFVEEDLFTWIMYPSIKRKASEIFEKLLRDLEIYDLDLIDEDVLKELYQDMIHPVIRKQLGEFYTPDWLAEKLVHDTLAVDPFLSVLDPSCGSGTFLFKTISYKIKKLAENGITKEEILTHILENVIGFDIHPLAALIAKTNYLLALKDILHSRKGPITIPVYLSDSLKLPTKKMEVTDVITTFEFDTQIRDKKFSFPLKVVDDIVKMDDIIEKMKIHGREFEEHVDDIKKSSYKINIDDTAKNLAVSFERSINTIKNNDEKQILLRNIRTLFDLIKDERDSIWPYVLRNMYKPIALTHKKVDVLIGNPPWISLRYMRNESYQNFVKEKSKHYDLIDDHNFQNIANLELATVFFYHCVDNYLNDDGIIAFVMPQSVIIASQHQKFRKFDSPPMKLLKIYDLEYVSPLFRIPSCVIICQKNKKTKYPVQIIRMSGKLSSNNMQLESAKDNLHSEESEFIPTTRKAKGGHYYDLFRRGAEITPRNFWFVDIAANKLLYYDPMKPYVMSAENKDSKKPWMDIKIEGSVEREFFFNTILGPDLIPFGVLRRRLIVLPILVVQNNVKMLSSRSPEIQQYDFTKYLSKIESLWKDNATDKLKKKPIYAQVNYNDNLVEQMPQTKYKVVYAANGANMTCAVIKSKEEYATRVGGSNFITDTFFADMAVYYYNTESKDEAHYLCSILNSNAVNEFIKPIQSRGDFGARNIHKSPLTFDIPAFDEKNTHHMRLANLGKSLEKEIERITPTLNLKSIGKIRSMIRDKISDELDEIDKIIGSSLN